MLTKAKAPSGGVGLTLVIKAPAGDGVVFSHPAGVSSSCANVGEGRRPADPVSGSGEPGQASARVLRRFPAVRKGSSLATACADLAQKASARRCGFSPFRCEF